MISHSKALTSVPDKTSPGVPLARIGKRVCIHGEHRKAEFHKRVRVKGSDGYDGSNGICENEFTLSRMATTTVSETVERQFIPIKVDELPPVQTFTIDSDPEDVVKALKISGGCRVRGAVSKDILAQIERDLRPHIEADVVWEGDFFPIQTRRVEGMIGKSPICAEHVINHPLYQAVCKEFLTKRNWYWSGDKKISATSDPQLNNSICFSIGPGAWNQPLHRDSWCHQTNETEVAVYPDNYDRDVGIGWFVAGKPATKENGATRFIPGSHLWSKDRPPQEELAVHAELEPGVSVLGMQVTVLTVLTGCFHDVELVLSWWLCQ